MRKLLTILFICLLQNSFGQTTWYISTTGSDATGNGTIGSPWASLRKATQSVTTSGDTIYINPGTYIETLPSFVSVGVSIKGAGVSSHIKSHFKGIWNENIASSDTTQAAAITFLSTNEGTNGNQSLSNILLDGDSLTANTGVLVRCRSNVLIHDITIKSFYINGIYYIGSAVNAYTKPVTYAVNNRLYNAIIDNCTDTAETNVGGALIYISGQQDLWIHDCTLSDTSRGPGANGDLIVNNRFGRGLKIYNNTSYKPSTSNAGWNFHYEIPWGNGGTEIYNNKFYGGDCAVDIGCFNGYYDQSAYSFSFKIHDNYYEDTNPTHNGSHGKTALSIEGVLAKDIYIYNETFKNIVQPFGLTDGTSPGTASHDTNIVIHNVVCMNMGVNSSSYFQNLVEINKIDSAGTLYGLYIENITMLPNSLVNAAAIKITNNNNSVMRNIVIGNNIFTGYKNGTWLNVNNTGGTLDSLIIRNNIIYNNANTNQPTFSGNAVTHYINSGNINSDPLLVSSTDYHLRAGSPAIGAAYNYGYGVDIGALQYTSTAPTISVSSDQTISVNNTSISAVGTPYSGHTITSYQWTQTQGTGTIGSPASASTTVSNLSTGVNKFQCTVTQDDSQTASGIVTITVNIPVAPTSYIKFRTPHKFINQ